MRASPKLKVQSSKQAQSSTSKGLGRLRAPVWILDFGFGLSFGFWILNFAAVVRDGETRVS
jgi:hypothetical protein